MGTSSLTAKVVVARRFNSGMESTMFCNEKGMVVHFLSHLHCQSAEDQLTWLESLHSEIDKAVAVLKEDWQL